MMRTPTQLLLQQVALLVAVGSAAAQFGQQQSAVANEDFPFPEYAQPWAVGQNVCAFLRTSAGRRIFTTCFPYKQKICGADTQFEYDCCPGFGNDTGYEGYRTGPLWPRNANCLKTLTDRDTRSDNDAYLQRLGADAAIRRKLRTDLPATSGQVTVFVASNGTYDTAKFRSGSGQNAYIVSGSYPSKELLDGGSLPLASGAGAVKITRYSNGIVCAECRRLMSADHPLDGRAVMHFTDGFVFSSSQSLAAVLQSQFPHFWADVPEPLRRDLASGGCDSSWYTVLVPGAGAWSDAKSKLGAGGDIGKLVREHVLPRLLCASAVCAESVANENLNGETLRLGCDTRGVYAQADHEFVRNDKAYLQPADGEIGVMATNGVVYQLSAALLHSAAFSFNEVAWPSVPPACVQLQPGKKYIFLVPRTSAWRRFNTSNAEINPDESMQQFSDLHATDAEYRCLVKRYHVLEADQPDLQRLWSQYNPAAWPTSKQPGAFRTLARWSDPERGAYGFLRNHLHFQKADTGPRLHFQFAPVRNAEGFDLREGRGYMVDWVNLPPNETASDFFTRRPDLQFHKRIVDQEAKVSGSSIYDNKATVQLIIVSKDEWYSRPLRSEHSGNVRQKDLFQAVSLTWNTTDYLLANWANVYYWIGDLGFLARGERVYLQSGHPDILLGIYRHATSGEFFVWHEFKEQSPEPMSRVRGRWLQVVEYNHFKTDAIIWIVDRPVVQCSRRLCRPNINGRTLLPWSLAAACGDFVSLPTTKSEGLRRIFRAAAGDMMRVTEETSQKLLDSGPNAGTRQPVSCFGAGMVMTRKYKFVIEEVLN